MRNYMKKLILIYAIIGPLVNSGYASDPTNQEMQQQMNEANRSPATEALGLLSQVSETITNISTTISSLRNDVLTIGRDCPSMNESAQNLDQILENAKNKLSSLNEGENRAISALANILTTLKRCEQAHEQALQQTCEDVCKEAREQFVRQTNEIFNQALEPLNIIRTTIFNFTSRDNNEIRNALSSFDSNSDARKILENVNDIQSQLMKLQSGQVRNLVLGLTNIVLNVNGLSGS